MVHVFDDGERLYRVVFSRDCRFREQKYFAGTDVELPEVEHQTPFTLREAVEAIEFHLDFYFPSDWTRSLGDPYRIEPEPPRAELERVRRALEDENPDILFSWSEYPE